MMARLTEDYLEENDTGLIADGESSEKVLRSPKGGLGSILLTSET